jgi:anthranilate synthase component 1
MRDHLHLWLNSAPDLLQLASDHPACFPFLLDSAAAGPLGAHSLLLFAGEQRLVAHPGGAVSGPGQGNTFFERLESWYQEERSHRPAACPDAEPGIPFVGGWFLFLAYEMAAAIEPQLQLPAGTSGLPDALAWRCPGAVIVFHASTAGHAPPAAALLVAETEAVMSAMLQLLQRDRAATTRSLPRLQRLAAEDPEKFQLGVEHVLEYLRAGDAFQVNISRRWSGRFVRPPAATVLYRRLRQSNPAPFAGLMRWERMALLSSSPERLVQIRGKRIQTRPIAGTRPRGSDSKEDMALSLDLIENVKERAEHIMLIDLERNDLGRVCVPGTVEVTELMVVESYAHVHHIVSNVSGELRATASPVDAIKAVFPGGTITGCPKVRCMEIIAELEQAGRSFYTGSMGYLGRDGSVDLNILIRTMLLDGEEISFNTGAGIVADSDPQRELLETEHKARGLMLALQQGPAEGPDA